MKPMASTSFGFHHKLLTFEGRGKGVRLVRIGSFTITVDDPILTLKKGGAGVNYTKGMTGN